MCVYTAHHSRMSVAASIAGRSTTGFHSTPPFLYSPLCSLDASSQAVRKPPCEPPNRAPRVGSS